MEDRGGDVARVIVELRQGVREVAADEPLCATEPLEGSGAQRVRIRPALLIPQPGQHELQERGCHPEVAVPVRFDRARARLTEGDRACPNLVEHVVHEVGLDRVLPVTVGQELVVPLHGPLDGPPGGRLVEMREPEVRAEEVADPSLEAVELGVGVLADRDDEAGAQVLAHHRPRELQSECSVAILVGVVEEVLLELVEDQQQLAARRLVAAGRERNGTFVEAADPFGEEIFQLGRVRRWIGRELAELVADGRLDRVGKRPQGVVSPPGADDEHRLGHDAARERRPGAGAEVCGESGPQERALTDAAGAVEECQPRRGMLAASRRRSRSRPK